jgi:hypothetical protein
MAVLGKIAGSMLKDNLIRFGVDLIIDSNLMYFDTLNRRIGINTTIPGNALTVNGNVTASNIYINGNTITSLSGNLNLTSLSGNISASNYRIINLATPLVSSDATTKSYVDSTIGNTIANANINFSDGSRNSNITINTGTFTFAGNANQINAYIVNNTVGAYLNLSFVSNPTVYGNLSIIGNIIGNVNGNLYGTVITSNQPYVSNIGTLGNLNVLSNINATNVNLSGNLTAANVSSNASITAAGTVYAANINVSGNIAGVNYINTNNLISTGNINSGNLNTTGNVSAAYYFGNGSTLSGMYGNTQANALLSSYTGNITANSVIATFYGNTYGTFANYTANINAGNVITNGNISANYYFGNGSTLSGMYGNTQTAAFLTTYNGNITAYSINANVVSSSITATAYNPNITLSTGYSGSLLINSNTAVLLPVGNLTNYPSVSLTGMVRYNTDNNYLELYNGNAWVPVQTGVLNTTVTSDIFTGNGVATSFTLSQNNTTQGTLVSINGVLQIPTTSYTVTGNLLTLGEAPLSTDVIEARSYSTTSQVSSIKNGNAAINLYTLGGFSSAVFTNDGLVPFELNSTNVNIQSSNLQVSGATVANVTPTTTVVGNTVALDTFSTAIYRTAKYIISASGTITNNFQSVEAIVTQGNGLANIIVSANSIIGNSLVTLSANVFANVTTLYAFATTNAASVKIYKTYIPV